MHKSTELKVSLNIHLPRDTTTTYIPCLNLIRADIRLRSSNKINLTKGESCDAKAQLF